MTCHRTCHQIWVLPLSSASPATRIVDAREAVEQPHLSPDGRWLAYAENDGRGWEVYVKRFELASERRRVSTTGGSEPMWRADGRELIYLALDGTFMSVDVQPDGALNLPRPLFTVAMDVNPAAHQYTMTPDASRFLVIVPDGSRTQPVNVTWWSALAHP